MPAPADCTFSGGPWYNGDGSLNITAGFRVQTLEQTIDGNLIAYADVTEYPNRTTGIVSFSRQQGITIKIEAPALSGFTVPATIVVPDDETYDLEDLANLIVATPPANGGFTITSGLTTFRAGTFNISGSGVVVTQSPTNVANLVISASSGASVDANNVFLGVNTFGAGTNYNEGAQALQGATAQAFKAAIGSAASPNSTNTPVLSLQKQDSSNPGAGISVLPFLFSVRKQSGNGNLYAQHTFLRQESATLTDAVAVTGSILAAPSTSPGGVQTHWAMWGRAERLSSATRISGAEFDAVNSTNTDASRSPSNANATFGINIVGTGLNTDQSSDPTVSARNTAAILIQTGNNNTKGAFFSGILFDANTVVDYALDLNNLGTVPIAPIRCANASYLTWRNAAGDNNISAFGVDTSNITRVRGDDASTAIRFSNTDNSVTYGTISANPIGLTMVGFVAASYFASGKTLLALSNGLNSNIDITTSSFARIGGPIGAFSVGGFLNGSDGRILILFNSVAQTMTIVNEDASSTAANRIATLTGGNVVLRASGQSCATFIYSTSDSRWLLVATN